MMRYFITFLLSSLALGAFAQCIPQGTNSSRYINNFSTTLGTQNITNNNSGFSTGGYGNFTGIHTLRQAKCAPINFSAAFVGGTFGFRIWIDLNQNNIFEASEVMYSSSSYSSSHSGTFSIPATALLGTTRMRIVAHWLNTSGDVDPCETGFTYGEFEDYTVIIDNGCSAPTGCTPDMTINTTTYSNTGLTTCGFGDDYSSSDACGSSYMNGEDIVIAYTPTTSECVNITLSNTGTWVGLFVLNNCPDVTGANCLANNTSSSGNPSISNFMVTAGTTYYIVVSTYPSPNCTAFDLDISSCNVPPINTCSATFYDSGGASGNYSGNEDIITTYCSSNSTCLRAVFSSFDTENSYDILYIYDGPNTSSPLFGSYSGTNSPGTITSSSGCLTFRFVSDGSAHRAGWAAAISCTSSCGTAPVTPPQDCLGATTICSDNTFSGNSGGFATQELSSSNNGCLSTEHQSSWYFFQATAAGTLEFTISPQNGTDDYDFAVWGPYPSSSTPGGICPPASTPLRCSYAGGGGNTGLGNGAVDFTEGAGGNKWVAPINMGLGDVYILLIDNYSSTNSPFDLNIDLLGGASLDCTPLPIELMSFIGEATESGNELQWQTMAEINNDYFVLEASKDASNFVALGNVDGAGNSVTPIEYMFLDENPLASVTYYRLKQVDFDGKFSYSDIISVKRVGEGEVVISPNPVKDVLYIEFKTTQAGNYNFMVVDILGAVIEKNIHLAKGSNNIKLDVFTNLSQGFYVLKIVDENNTIIATEKIVKN